MNDKLRAQSRTDRSLEDLSLKAFVVQYIFSLAVMEIAVVLRDCWSILRYFQSKELQNVECS